MQLTSQNVDREQLFVMKLSARLIDVELEPSRRPVSFYHHISYLFGGNSLQSYHEQWTVPHTSKAFPAAIAQP
ncbi:hypothetical protein OPV22_015750 [Ensete ventricosum]|uniref:Uncharacterized protein n=1 Tax=Ensete ventricosum TaxID=4639 RepID=A0AAV8PTN3_ENSVE|nr:hypothetical protein OPV22_015750 [Ensete ventricosum]